MAQETDIQYQEIRRIVNTPLLDSIQQAELMMAIRDYGCGMKCEGIAETFATIRKEKEYEHAIALLHNIS